MTAEPGICTVDGCDVPTQEYLCHHCTQELQDAWDQIPDLVPVLRMIARGEEKSQALSTASGGGGGHRGGSRPPMNLSAYQLALNLSQALMYTPAEYATHSDGRRAHAQILEWVRHADLMVNGETEDVESKKNIARYKLGALPPMSAPDLSTWFKDQLGEKVTAERIRLWAHRGHITPITTGSSPTYSPVAVYVAYSEMRTHA